MERVYKTQDVYGISRELPMNYIERSKIDSEFIDSLSREKHIVVFGSSKQGKTCLRKNCLLDDDYIVIHCSNKWQLSDLNTNILKRAGFEITQSTTKSSTGKNKIMAKIKALLPVFGIELENEEETSNSTEVVKCDLELDIDDVNDLIAALKSVAFNKYVLLEDFHYLKPEVQRDFSIELKAIHENSKITFIIIGVWLDENRLTTYNGDLIGRLISINADIWERKELLEVIEAGEALLNVSFTQDFKANLISNCNESVYILQEACYKVCTNNHIYQTQANNVAVGQEVDVKQLIKEIIAQQSGRYNSFITNFADGFQTTKLEMYKWILYPILTTKVEILEKGLRLRQLKDIIMEKHPKGTELNVGNLTQSLKSSASLQVNKGILPIIIDYDETNLRLQVVDKGFLVWLSHQNINDLLDLAGLPTFM